MAATQQIAFNFDNIINSENKGKEILSNNLPNNIELDIEINKEIIEVDDILLSTNLQDKKSNKKLTRGRTSLKKSDSGIDLIDVPEDDILFKKMYYSIGSVAKMFKVNHSLIRFWENEFDILKPKKNAKGDRHFRPEDVKNLKLIYHLLREKKFTLEGAKTFLQQQTKSKEQFELIESLKKIKLFLLDLKANL